MKSLIDNINVLEILRIGLSGLLFLLSFLAFRLIDREQQRSGAPRKGILRTIYVFMTVNLVSAALVAGAGYVGGGNKTEHAATVVELRKAQDQLLRIRSAAGPLLSVRDTLISDLPAELPQKNALQSLLAELKKTFAEDDKQ